MIGVMRGWWSEFKEKHNICHWNQGIKWSRYHANSGIKELGVEYHFGLKARRLMLSLEVDNGGETLYLLRLGIPLLFNFYISVDAKPNRFTKWFAGEDWSLGGRETGFSIDKDFVRLSLHKATDGWSRDKRCGWGGIWTWRDLFMGDHDADLNDTSYCTHTGDVIASKGRPAGQKDVVFDAEIKVYRSRYSRWYLFWYRPTYTRIALKPRAEIIVPGKGENSWDCDDEKMGEISFGWHTKTLDDALREYNKHIHRCMTRC
jgi:hypothetical protein